jgi:tetratricopeptide (TPR) repeat protein
MTDGGKSPDAARAKVRAATANPGETASRGLAPAESWGPGNALRAVRRFAVDLGTLAFIGSLGWVLLSASMRPVVTIQAFGVPPALAEAGFSGAILAQMLADELSSISRRAPTTMERQGYVPEASFDPHSVEVSGVRLSPSTLASYLRTLLRLPEERVVGEVTGSDARLRLGVRVRGHEPKFLAFSRNRPTESLTGAAEHVLRSLEPYVLASYLYHVKRTKECESLLDDILRDERRDDDGRAYNLRGLIFLDGKRFEEAIRWFRRADQTDRERSAIYKYNWGKALVGLGRPNEAIVKFERSVSLDPGFAQPYNDWGFALAQTGQHEEAADKFERAIQLDPTYAYAHNNLGNSLDELGCSEDALESFRRAADFDSSSAGIFNNWGAALANLGRTEQAIENYRRATELDPASANAYHNWGEALSSAGRPNEAIAKYRRSLELRPRFAYALEGWGRALARLERHEEALRKFRQAVELEPDYAEAYRSWANSLQALGRSEEAREKERSAEEIESRDRSDGQPETPRAPAGSTRCRRVRSRRSRLCVYGAPAWEPRTMVPHGPGRAR